MQMKRAITLSAGALSLCLSALVVSSPAAQADNGACPANSFCLFEHDNYGGQRAVFTRTTRHLGGVHFPDGSHVGDKASSMINNRNRKVYIYEDGDCGGLLYVAKKESSDRDFSDNYNPTDPREVFDNKASCVVFK
ncbi:peptidase inhibitor family I36 protein [Streptomyces flaveolus]|uniref:peptidase inhibitor family I36 protein n=1 Tax=Streptomyces flaveolus TaxID=67297 RepID=UPI0033BCDB06